MSDDIKNALGKPGVDENAAFSDVDEDPEKTAVENLSVESEEQDKEEEDFELPKDPVLRLQKVAKLLAAQYQDAPNVNALAAWKQVHGEIFVTPIDDRTFVHRYLKRQEWSQMLVNEDFQKMNDLQTEEYIFDKCILWPGYTSQQKAALPAGIISTMSQAIRLSSGFLNAEALIQFTIKL